MKTPEARIADRINKMRELLADPAVISLLDQRAPEYQDWQRRLAELELSISRPPETHLALIGSTGAGKSTLLNALVGAQILPVSSMRACTAVVTSVRYAPEPTYSAHVRFLTVEEWNKELSASVEFLDIEIGDEERSDVTDWNELNRITRDKLQAVYGRDQVGVANNIRINELELPESLLTKMDAESQPLLIRGASVKEFQNQLKRYLSSDSAYWPVVKSVEVFGKFEALRHGAVLIDLPGVNDPNQAREEVTRSFLRDAAYVWVVFNMNRGITKDIRDLLLEQKMLRQFLLEGKVHALTLVGTRADDLSGIDATEYSLDDEATNRDIIQERNKQVRDLVRNDLCDIADDLGAKSGADADSLTRLTDTLKQTLIFTASTRAYMKLKGIGQHRLDYGIENLDDTEVPQLVQHIERLCHGQDYEYEIDQKVSLLKSEIESFFRARRTQHEGRRGELGEKREGLRTLLEQPRRKLEEELSKAKQRAEESFRAHEEIFESHLKIKVASANADVDRVLDSWQGMHWATLKACVIRNGQFTSPSTSKRHDFNADIAGPLLNAIPFIWDDFFGHHFETSLAELKGELKGRAEVFLAKLGAEARGSHAFDHIALDALLGDIEVSKEILDFKVKESLKALGRTINRKRIELSTSITVTIGKQMKAAYARAKLEQGSGMKQRMLNILRPYALQRVSEMYETIQNDLVEGISELGVQLSDKLNELNEHVGAEADRVLSNLGGGSFSDKGDDIVGTIQKIDVLLGRIKEL